MIPENTKGQIEDWTESWYKGIDTFSSDYKFDLQTTCFSTKKGRFFIEDQLYFIIKKIEENPKELLLNLSKKIKNTAKEIISPDFNYTYTNNKEIQHFINSEDIISKKGIYHKKIKAKISHRHTLEKLLNHLNSMKFIELNEKLSEIFDLHLFLKFDTDKLPPYISGVTSEENKKNRIQSVKNHILKLSQYKIDLVKNKIEGEVNKNKFNFIVHSQVIYFINNFFKKSEQSTLLDRTQSFDTFLANNRVKLFGKDKNNKNPNKEILRDVLLKQEFKTTLVHIFNSGENNFFRCYRNKLDDLFGSSNIDFIFHIINQLPSHCISQHQSIEILKVIDSENSHFKNENTEISLTDANKNFINKNEDSTLTQSIIEISNLKINKKKSKKRKEIQLIKKNENNTNNLKKNKTISVNSDIEIKNNFSDSIRIENFCFKDEKETYFSYAPIEVGNLNLEITGRNFTDKMLIQFAFLEDNSEIDWTYAPTLPYLMESSTTLKIDVDSSWLISGKYALQLSSNEGKDSLLINFESKK